MMAVLNDLTRGEDDILAKDVRPDKAEAGREGRKDHLFAPSPQS